LDNAVQVVSFSEAQESIKAYNARLGGSANERDFAQRSLSASTTATTKPVTTMVRRSSGSGICRP
jgi:hypothetical protein